MVTRIRHVAPIKLAVFSAILYALLGIIGALFAAPMMALMATYGGHVPPGFGAGIGMVLLFPIMYGVLGFIGGLITAAIYNLVAGWTGGVELTLEGVPSNDTPGVGTPA